MYSYYRKTDFTSRAQFDKVRFVLPEFDLLVCLVIVTCKPELFFFLIYSCYSPNKCGIYVGD